ncbi:hypothetical protein NPIL_282021 [Nephila pilipes]|uniref:Uncharacterized protein n=1 Tax=Nephila pilipes TaxID=299642 RepID=A0A8X6QD09_NEPPI|nr:hypothetical protein NPIL_282021 [Nephila pilipes]
MCLPFKACQVIFAFTVSHDIRIEEEEHSSSVVLDVFECSNFKPNSTSRVTKVVSVAVWIGHFPNSANIRILDEGLHGCIAYCSIHQAQFSSKALC